MSHRLACFTLFDITKTGVLNRARPSDDTVIDDWAYKRNTQCNFDTIIQVISLRSQPDVVTEPKKKVIKLDKNSNFGYTYHNLELPVWSFDFEVHHSSVFEDGIEELGALYKDCTGVPMIKCGTEYDKISNILDSNNTTRNIYFVKY
jgi:hypothetical protein